MSGQSITSNAKGTVYFIEGEGCGLIKIGFTAQSLDARLEQLRRHSPAPLRVLGVIAGDFALERELHGKFLPVWSHGEWFRDNDDLRGYIGEHAGPWEERPRKKPRSLVPARPTTPSLQDWAASTPLTCKGVTRTALEWSERFKVSLLSMRLSLLRGYDAETLLSQPWGMAPAKPPYKKPRRR